MIIGDSYTFLSNQKVLKNLNSKYLTKGKNREDEKEKIQRENFKNSNKHEKWISLHHAPPW
jgi:hypothetical protein